MARTTGTVSLHDLVRKGALIAGERIEIRRRSAPPIVGSVEADGTITVGRRSFETPSGAARHALEVGTTDGWLRWRVPRLDGQSLAEIRASL